MIEKVKGKRVYLSGPMSGKPDWNRAAFAEAERACRIAGATHVFNPAASAPQGSDMRGRAWWMLKDVHELTRRGEDGPFYDLVLQLPGWEVSRGARFEQACAVVCGIDVREVGKDAR